MATVLRAFGNALVWVLALVGAVGGLAWGATRLGWVQPLVVVSGSMSPGIATGDLLVDRPMATADLRPGDVASLRSAVTGRIVTHRVVAVDARPDGTWDVTLKGDANDAPDAETYVVGGTVWRPAALIPGGGAAVTTLTRPSVAAPLAVALLALFGLSLLPGRGGRGVAPHEVESPSLVPDAPRGPADVATAREAALA